jgi:hypothetical protein
MVTDRRAGGHHPVEVNRNAVANTANVASRPAVVYRPVGTGPGSRRSSRARATASARVATSSLR